MLGVGPGHGRAERDEPPAEGPAGAGDEAGAVGRDPTAAGARLEGGGVEVVDAFVGQVVHGSPDWGSIDASDISVATTTMRPSPKEDVTMNGSPVSNAAATRALEFSGRGSSLKYRLMGVVNKPERS